MGKVKELIDFSSPAVCADVFVDGVLGFFLCIDVIFVGLQGGFVDCSHVGSSYGVVFWQGCLVRCLSFQLYGLEGGRAIGGGELEEIGNYGQREKDRAGGCCPACTVFLSDVYELVKRLFFLFTELSVYGICVIIRCIVFDGIINLADPGYRFL